MNKIRTLMTSIAFYMTTDLTNLKCLALGRLKGVEMPGLRLNLFAEVKKYGETVST